MKAQSILRLPQPQTPPVGERRRRDRCSHCAFAREIARIMSFRRLITGPGFEVQTTHGCAHFEEATATATAATYRTYPTI